MYDNLQLRFRMFYFEEKKVLPFSNGRYYLNKFGDIFDSNENLIEVIKIDRCKKVWIEWVDGAKYYELGVIIAIVKYSVNLPTCLWNRIEARYIDENPNNTNTINIYYGFNNGPIELENKPGFYYVPYYTRYAISKEGILYSIRNDSFQSWCFTKYQEKKNIKGGYAKAWANSDNEKSKNISRHRALGLTFIHYPKSPFKLVINHKNGIPGFDNLDNLEWVTYSQNNQHALDYGLMPNSTIPVSAKNLITGITFEFMSLEKASKETNISPQVISNRLNEQRRYFYEDGWIFKRKVEKDWPITDQRIKNSGGYFTVMAKDIFSGEIIIFSGIDSASDGTGVHITAIREHVNGVRSRPLHGFIFKYKTLNIEWPVFSDKELLIYREFPTTGGRGIISRDENGNEIAFYASSKIAAKELNSSIAQIEKTCHGIRKIKGKNLSFYELNN